MEKSRKNDREKAQAISMITNFSRYVYLREWISAIFARPAIEDAPDGEKIVDAVCDRVTPYAVIWRKAETKYRTYKSHVVRNSRNSLTPAATAETAPRTFGTPV